MDCLILVGENMYIDFKLVTEKDCGLLFVWANDVEVRKNAFNSKAIQYKEHKKWLGEKLKSKNTKMFILYVNEEAVGQIRIDVENDEIGVLDYSIIENRRGKGYGSIVLLAIDDILEKYDIKVKQLVGMVKYDNIASRKAFIKAGYEEKYEEEYVRYIKILNGKGKNEDSI